MQIFKRLPQTVTFRHLEEEKVRMDSNIPGDTESAGFEFNRLVEIYSDDKQSRWIEGLETTSEFEDVAFSLAKGAVSQPFFTPEGIHILKVMDREETAAYEKCQCQVNGTVTAQGDFGQRYRRGARTLEKGMAVCSQSSGNGRTARRKAVQNKPCLRLTDKHTPELCSRILPLLILNLSNASWKGLLLNHYWIMKAGI